MKEHGVFTSVLAVLGTLLVALPLLAPLVLGLAVLGRPGGFRFDYLMPFEIYPVTLVGVVLLLIAAFRARLRRGAAGIAVALMLGGVVLGAVSAKLTGIADSVEQLEAWRYAITIGFGAVSIVGQAALIVIGGLLTRDLAQRSHANAPPLTPAAGS